MVGDGDERVGRLRLGHDTAAQDASADGRRDIEIDGRQPADELGRRDAAHPCSSKTRTPAGPTAKVARSVSTRSMQPTPVSG
ncbi:MAG: hypothetical protein ABT15_01465 [Pseudonocardia sp. SCN 73-27]|nr:MAG: hypothetical protein ABS80_04075 [Pseudonocardia sp. SCN 72-51]ODV08937.1 MAG: hypothetical protein ABT15_01465 [Pseudonocardia sp. SCN 73-27]